MVLRRRRTEDGRLVEAVEHDGGRARGQRAEQPGAQAVHVEEREGKDEAVLGLPLPGVAQRRDAGQERGMGVHRPLGLARGPRRVDDQGVVARAPAPSRVRARRGTAARTPELGPRRTTGRTATEHVRPIAVADGERRRGVADHVVRSRASVAAGLSGTSDRAGRSTATSATTEGERGAGAPQDPVARPDAVAGQDRGQRAVRPSSAARVDDPCGVPSVDEHGRVRVGRPLPGPHRGQRADPAAPRTAVAATVRGDERPHRRRPQVIVWRS